VPAESTSAMRGCDGCLEILRKTASAIGDLPVSLFVSMGTHAACVSHLQMFPKHTKRTETCSDFAALPDAGALAMLGFDPKADLRSFRVRNKQDETSLSSGYSLIVEGKK
jgi:hypothetical protein